MATRAAKTKATGKKAAASRRSRPNQARADDQINLTDEASRIMKVAGGGFEQCYNAQAVVDTESMLVLAPHVTQAATTRSRSSRWWRRCGRIPKG
jgi:hypothetical protein